MVRVQDKLALLVLRSYNSMKKDERLMATGSLRRRLYALCRHPALRYGLSQPNCIDFRYLMDQGISIIMNLGTLRTRPVKKMLGCILLVMLEQAALGRLSAEKVSKRPFRLLLDEWPAFAAQDQSLSDILSQTAKCQFNIALACQTTSQISAHGLMGAMENCRQLCIFGVGVGSAKDLAETMAQTNALVVKEEALTSTQHNLYEHYQEQIREVMEQNKQNQSLMNYLMHWSLMLGQMETTSFRQWTEKQQSSFWDDVDNKHN